MRSVPALWASLVAVSWVHVVGSFGERSQSSYKEEIVFPERLNSSFRQGQPLWPGNADESPSENRLSFRFHAFGEELILDMEKDPSFLSEDLTVQYLGRNGQSDANSLSDPGSYFTGAVNSDPESIAAVNYNGVSLVGVLQYRGAEYHIQPLEGDGPNSVEGNGEHIIRRKVPNKTIGPMCNVGPEVSRKASEDGEVNEKPMKSSGASMRSKNGRFVCAITIDTGSVPTYSCASNVLTSSWLHPTLSGPRVPTFPFNSRTQMESTCSVLRAIT
ncbi:hypothetical protein GDO86_019648 [Hymenochirus boettgeri]|uniref:Peptidase M12B propeptide domain-containing protein n=1 Tax=Hymenochirus boettgeri TaxID=247094 RepID=A0A8T2IG29_9PIPI|nr:hypothetical protein GDO86_019648 [Hymenochirus boettgeri]